MRALTTKSGRTIQSPWFTAEEAAAYLRIESADGSLHAFYLAYVRMGIPAYRFRGGREFRFKREDLDAALTPARVIDHAEEERLRGFHRVRPARESRQKATDPDTNRRPE